MPVFREEAQDKAFFKSIYLLSQHVFPRIARLPIFWFLLIFHIVLYVAFHRGMLDEAILAKVEDDDFNVHYDVLNVEPGTAGVIVTIATVFQVFYAQNCFSRYLKFHASMRSIVSSIHDFAFRMHIHGPQHMAKPYDFVAIRQVLVAFILFLHEAHRRADDFSATPRVNDEYDMHDEDWDRLIIMGVLHPAEKIELEPVIMEERIVKLLTRSAAFVQRSLMEAHAPPSYFEAIFKSLSTIRYQMDQVITDIKFPLPFAYFHLMQSLLTVCLSLLAYIFARNMSYMAPFAFIISMVSYMGLREISTNVQNPFGNDPNDYPLKDWLFDTFENLDALLKYDHEKMKEVWTAELEVEVASRTRFGLTEQEIADLLSPPETKTPDAVTLPQAQDSKSGYKDLERMAPDTRDLALKP